MGKAASACRNCRRKIPNSNLLNRSTQPFECRYAALFYFVLRCIARYLMSLQMTAATIQAGVAFHDCRQRPNESLPRCEQHSAYLV